LLVVAAIMVATAASAFCPLYSLVGIKTVGAGDTRSGAHRNFHLHRGA